MREVHMSNNTLDTQAWVNPYYWLTTWRETYSHKVGRPKKKRNRSKHKDEAFVKDGGNNAEASSSESRKAQQTDAAVCQDCSGVSGVGVVIGLSAADSQGGAGGSQGSSYSRQTKRRV
nr:hypothetical protein [Tanacetum cinerariifolium]